MERPTFDEELRLWNSGCSYVVGLDEVGRGAFAGPLVAAGVVFPKFFSDTPRDADAELLLRDIRDSKQLTPQARTKLTVLIRKYAYSLSVVEVPVSVINRFGVGKANSTAFRLVLNTLCKTMKAKGRDFFVLLDGFHVAYLKGGRRQQKAIVKGDQKSISIAAASIIAKVYRDTCMSSLPRQYNRYNFSANKGYGTKIHQEAIKKYGLCPLHRTSFKLHSL